MGREPARGYSPWGVVPCHARPADKLAGPQPGCPVQWRSGPCVSAGYTRVGRAHGVVTAHDPHARRRGGKLFGGKVYPRSTSGAPGWRRAMWRSVGLTWEVGRPGGGRMRWLVDVLRRQRDPEGGPAGPCSNWGERRE
jgi:hypothetical protein